MTKRIVMGRLLGLVFTSIASLLLSACVSTIKLPERSLPEAVIDPLQLSAGVYYDEGFLDRGFPSEKKSGVRYFWKPGPAVARAFEDILGASFQKIVRLDEPPFDDSIPPELDVLITISIRSFTSYASPETVQQGAGRTSLIVDVTLNTINGDEIDRVSVGGRAYYLDDIKISDFFNLDEYNSYPAQAAIRGAAAEFATSFRESPGVAKWLDQMNATRPALESAPNSQPEDPLLLADSLDIEDDTPGLIAILSDDDAHAECLEENILKVSSAWRIMGTVEFTNAFYPWFEDVDRSVFVDRFRLMTLYPRIQERARELGLMHAIWIEGYTYEGDIFSPNDKSWGGCLDPYGMACMGMRYADKESRLRTLVLNLTQSGPLQAQAIEHTVTDEIVWPAIFISLIPFIPDTEEEACELLGHEIASHLLNKPITSPQ